MSNEERTSYYAYRAAWGGRLRRNLLPGLKGRLSDRKIQHIRGGFGVPCMERKSQAIMNVTQVKNEIRYLSLSDKIEIYRWLDGELAGYLSSRIGSRRSLAIRRQIEGIWNLDGNGDKPNSFISELRTGLRTSTSSRSKTV